MLLHKTFFHRIAQMQRLRRCFARNIKIQQPKLIGKEDPIEQPVKTSPKSKPSLTATKEDYIKVEKLLEKKNQGLASMRDIDELSKKLIKMKYNPKQIAEILYKTGKLEDFPKEKKVSKARTSELKELDLSEFANQLDPTGEIALHASEMKKIQEIIKSKEESQLASVSTYAESTSPKIKYDDFVDQVITGQSLLDQSTLAETLSPSLAKKFAKNDIEEIKKQRVDLIATRSEIAFLDDFFESNKEVKAAMNEDKLADPINFVPTSLSTYELDHPKERGQLDVTPHKELNIKRAKEFAELFNIPEEMAIDIYKKDFFDLKKIEEIDAQKELIEKKRQKRKEIKKMVDFMRKNSFEVKDYDKEELNYSSVKDKQNQELSNILNLEKFKNHVQAQKEKDGILPDLQPTTQNKPSQSLQAETKEYIMKEVLRKTDSEETKSQTGDHKNNHSHYDIFRMHTLHNMYRYLTQFFHNYSEKVSAWTNGYMIKLDEILIGESIRKVYLFWEFIELNDQLFQTEKEKKQVIEEINTSLNKYSGVLGGYVCRDLEMRRAPVIQFYKSNSNVTLNEVRKSLDGYLPKKVEEELRNKDPSKYEQLKKQGQLETYLKIRAKELEYVALGNADNLFTNKQQLSQLIKSQDKAPPKNKKERNNRNPDGTRKKYNREDPSDAFWKNIMSF